MLMWRVPDLKRSAKITALLQLLRDDIHMSPMDLLLYCTNPSSSLEHYRKGFFRSDSTAIESFLEAVKSHPTGEAKLNNWARSQGLKVLLDDVHNEMDKLKDHFSPSPLSRTTPEFLMKFDFEESMTAALSDIAPITNQSLLSAAHSNRASISNSKKSPKIVSDVLLHKY